MTNIQATTSNINSEAISLASAGISAISRALMNDSMVANEEIADYIVDKNLNNYLHVNIICV